MAKRASTIIAKTFGIDSAEIESYRYQSTRTPFPVYAIGNRYFCVRATQPDHYDFAWTPYSDQFFANLEHKVLYVAA